jgi:hypothetical protein
MTHPAEQFPYIQRDAAVGAMSLMAVLPLRLDLAAQSVDATGLVDTGSSINVLPYSVGLHLGAVWENQTASFYLDGAVVSGRNAYVKHCTSPVAEPSAWR